MAQTASSTILRCSAYIQGAARTTG